jgi:hypothetical protein
VRALIRPSAISRLGGVAGAIWLLSVGPAWAGSGASVGSLQGMVLDPLCQFMGITSCPQFPTVNQIVAEISALENIPPNVARFQLIGLANGLDQTSGACTVAGNSFGSTAFVPCDTLAINAVNPLSRSSVDPSGLSNLTPLAFATSSGSAIPVPLGVSGENSFFYAAVTETSGQHTLDLFFDYAPWTAKQFVKGQTVATVQFPMVVLSAGSERSVSATLQVTATCNGAASCLSGTVTGDFVTAGIRKSYPAGQLGLQIGYNFGSSPNSAAQHGLLELQLPVIVTQATDPAYFGVTPPFNTNGATPGAPTYINQASGLPTAFSSDDSGFNFMGMGVGVPPYPAPQCTPGDAACPSDPTVTPVTFYAICATIANRPAVAAFLSVGTDGTTYASSPVPVQGVNLPQCPPGN